MTEVVATPFQTRDLVLPGDVLFEGSVRTGENTYRHEGKVLATRIGLVEYSHEMVSVIALEAGYSPLVGDLVIGDIIEMELGEWTVNVDAPNYAILSVSDATGQPFRPDIVMPRILDVGDTIAAKIVEIDRRRTPILSILGRGLGKLQEGFIMRITPSKIPRLIGKKGSMVNMILKETGCDMVIGQNGRILISGRTREQEEMVVKVVDKIEGEAHTSGLTNRIQDYLKSLKGEQG